MPPAFTLAGSGSFGKTLPVTMPGPQPLRSVVSQRMPLNARARGMHFDGSANVTLKSQPRFVFSMPYSAALGVLVMPGGKWMPLMKRTVREERGAWLWLKNAAVRATPTARSRSLTGAPGFSYSASTRPARSTTAMVVRSGSAFAAARTIESTSLEASEVPPSEQVSGAIGVIAQAAGSSALMTGFSDGERRTRPRAAALVSTTRMTARRATALIPDRRTWLRCRRGSAYRRA
jgi:hypothetical protein